MRRLRWLGIGIAALAALSGAVPTATVATPPEDRVTIVGPFVDEVDCDGESITRAMRGWVGIPADADTPTFYHLTWDYSNAGGAVWQYVDTGLIRTFVRDGDLYISLSGRSINVGPDETGWIGHWELNTVTEEVSRAGLGLGPIDGLACRPLT